MFLQYDGGSFAKIVLLIIMRFDIAVHFFYSSTEVFIYCCVSREKQNLKKKFEKSRRWNFIKTRFTFPYSADNIKSVDQF